MTSCAHKIKPFSDLWFRRQDHHLGRNDLARSLLGPWSGYSALATVQRSSLLYCSAPAPHGACIVTFLGGPAPASRPQIRQPCRAPSPVQGGCAGGTSIPVREFQPRLSPGPLGSGQGEMGEPHPILWGPGPGLAPGPSLLGGAWPWDSSEMSAGEAPGQSSPLAPLSLPSEWASLLLRSLGPGPRGSPLPSSE